jgi:hypothetical protein
MYTRTDLTLDDRLEIFSLSVPKIPSGHKILALTGNEQRYYLLISTL